MNLFVFSKRPQERDSAVFRMHRIIVLVGTETRAVPSIAIAEMQNNEIHFLADGNRDGNFAVLEFECSGCKHT